MQSTIRSTNRRTAQHNMLGYLCTLVLLVLAIGLLALRSPTSTSMSMPLRVVAPAAAPLAGPDAQHDSYLGSYGG